eukprot:snap_masked-scaffold_15-processed-gene-1.16-mRNA-1 protein AED:1.00 eAED:1.00 QI:0/0/0/0/1/1/3/0/70
MVDLISFHNSERHTISTYPKLFSGYYSFSLILCLFKVLKTVPKLVFCPDKTNLYKRLKHSLLEKLQLPVN